MTAGPSPVPARNLLARCIDLEDVPDITRFPPRPAWPFLFLPVLILPFAFWIAVVLHPPLNHDVAGLLAFTEGWLGGAALYRDLIEVNPPLIILMNAPAVLLGPWVPGGPVRALQLLLLLGCAVATILAWVLLARDPSRGPLERATLSVAIPMLTLTPGYDFGQRSHILMNLLLPYLLLAVRRVEGPPVARRLALPIALLAAIGIALKPHFLLFPLVVEAFVLVARRRGGGRWRDAARDPLPWAMAAVWVLYMAVVMAWFPDYLRHTLPLARSAYVSLQAVSASSILLTDRVLPYLLLALPAGVFALRAGYGALPPLLLLVVLAGTAVAVLQHKGFGYHSLPVRLAATLLVVAVAARWLDRGLPRRPGWAAPIAMGAAVAWTLGVTAMLGAEAPWSQLRYAGSETDQLAELFTAEAPEGEVLVLSPAVNGIYPALNYARARNILPTMTIWPLQSRFLPCPPPSALTPAGMDPEQRWFFETTVRNFATRRPRLLVVAPDQRRVGCEKLDLLRYFAQDPRFVEALEEYRPRPSVFGYRVWRRVATPRLMSSVVGAQDP